MPLPMNKTSNEVVRDKNREAWLTELSHEIKPLFKTITLGPYRLTCGWPSRLPLGKKVRILGQCVDPKNSKGAIHEICVTPLLDDPLQVAGVVCHELTHVAAGVAAGHKGLFIKLCKQLGLTKNKPTQAMPGPVLEGHLHKITERLGPYPHQAIVPTWKDDKKEKTNFSVICLECGCLIHMSNKWIQEVGFPTCACGSEMTLKGG